MLRHGRLRAPGIIGFVAGIYLISGAQGWFREEAIGFPVWIVGHIILIVGTLAVGLSVVFKPPPTQLTLREPAPSGIYRATLIDAGKKKGEVQQVLKQVSKDSGFRIAMIVERTPALLLENVSEEAARSLARRLEEFGATVEVAMNPEM
jgi:hypothetical protein